MLYLNVFFRFYFSDSGNGEFNFRVVNRYFCYDWGFGVVFFFFFFFLYHI
jgi:hypothetical protein